MTETISKLTRVNPDWNISSINVELTSTFFTLQNFKYIRQFKRWKSQDLCCSAMYHFYSCAVQCTVFTGVHCTLYCRVVYNFYYIKVYSFYCIEVYSFHIFFIFSSTRQLFTFSTCSTRPLSTPPPNLNNNIQFNIELRSHRKNDNNELFLLLYKHLCKKTNYQFYKIVII